MRMSRTFQGLALAYSMAANTQQVGMNIWCNAESLTPLNPAMMPVIGTVSADTAGDFLGVVSPIEHMYSLLELIMDHHQLKQLQLELTKLMTNLIRAKAYTGAKAANGGQEPSYDQINAALVFKYNITPQFAEPTQKLTS